MFEDKSAKKTAFISVRTLVLIALRAYDVKARHAEQCAPSRRGLSQEVKRCKRLSNLRMYANPVAHIGHGIAF